MQSYTEACWYDYSYRQAYAIMQQLLFDGKLSQQRRYGGKPDLSDGIWTPATDEDITWYNHTHPIITDKYDLKIPNVITDIVDEMKDVIKGRHETSFK